jgi:hypothetical protein
MMAKQNKNMFSGLLSTTVSPRFSRCNDNDF